MFFVAFFLTSSHRNRTVFAQQDAQQNAQQDAQRVQAANAEKVAPATAYRIQVDLPLAGDADTRVIRQLKAVPPSQAEVAKQRAVVVLEFRSVDDGQTDASQFERCLALARFISSDEMGQVRVVAYLTGPVEGHAVLPVLACEEIATTTNASLGPATLGEQPPEQTVVQSYLDIASRRRTSPRPLTLALVDPQRHVLAVELLDGSRVIENGELAELQRTETVTSVETLTRPGAAARIDAATLRKLLVSKTLIDQPAMLAAALGVASIQPLSSQLAGPWRAVRWRLHGAFRAADLQDKVRQLQQLVADKQANLLVLDIDSPGGEPLVASQLANAIARLDAKQIRTLAHVQMARGDAWLLAVACDEITATRQAALGGDGAAALSPREASALGAVAKRLAAIKGRTESFSNALLDRNVQLMLFRNAVTGVEQPWSPDEHAAQKDREQWRQVRLIETIDGVEALDALKWGQIDRLSETLNDALSSYPLESGELVEPKGNWVTKQVERLAGIPWLPQLLLSIGFFALLAEFSAPGLGAPGFLSALCFLLFFWIQFLNGTAGQLEIALFLGGLVFLLVELFALPGFGIFGIGGIVLVLMSLVLASQTFVLPANSYQWSQVPSSMGAVAAALGGVIGGAVVMRRLIPHAPYLQKMVLEQAPEELVVGPHDGLRGKLGVAKTPLRPAGKAEFGDQLVDVLTSGEPIEKGARVVVKDVQGSRVIVATVDSLRQGARS